MVPRDEVQGHTQVDVTRGYAGEVTHLAVAGRAHHPEVILMAPVGFHIARGQHEIERAPPSPSCFECLGQHLEIAVDVAHQREFGSYSLCQAKNAASLAATQFHRLRARWRAISGIHHVRTRRLAGGSR